MKKYICIHGHFYQPPRENAWLETIEQQDSAYPYHDWNERINSECYSPNAASRILNDKKKIVDITNNYSRISFNFGPTLLSWMEENASDVYRAIIEADKESINRFSGHGSALAQVYNHIIMPLANRRDKETQVRWGIHDFKHRFNRQPEGMWLAETAVDIETLEVLAEENIKYTILAPRQIKRFRLIGDQKWTSPDKDPYYSSRPYTCKLPSGETITLFFYHGELSQAVAFKGLLKDGKSFANEIFQSFTGNDNKVGLSHIATDGESYGHHHPHGDMALAYCLKEIENNKEYVLTNYSEFLANHPPQYEAEIHENSSWSCVHGVERWRTDCGCNSGGKPGWHQKWREPLRNTLDSLRDKLISLYISEMPEFCDEIWNARNAYIEVILDRSDSAIKNFIHQYCSRSLGSDEETKFLCLLELQRNAMLMYTSCGWFFDDISGIETIQILQYANRAIQLAERESNLDLNDWFKRELKLAKSNSSMKDGSSIYEHLVEPKRLTLSDVAGHYAVGTLFSNNPEELDIWNYTGKSDDFERHEAGDFVLAIGRTNVTSKVTRSIKKFDFAVLYLGQSHIIGSMSVDFAVEHYKQVKEKMISTFKESHISETIGLLQEYFGQQKFSIWNMFKDDQRRVLAEIAEKSVDEADEILRNIYNRNYNLMTMLRKVDLPLPILFRKNKEAVINHELISLFRNGILHPSRLETLENEALTWDIPLDETKISYEASNRIFSLFKDLQNQPDDIKLLRTILRVMKSLKNLHIHLNLVRSQDTFFQVTKLLYTKGSLTHDFESSDADEWDDLFKQIESSLNMAVLPATKK